VFGGNDCLQQPDTLVTKCRGSKDHEYWCAIAQHRAQCLERQTACLRSRAVLCIGACVLTHGRDRYQLPGNILCTWFEGG